METSPVCASETLAAVARHVDMYASLRDAEKGNESPASGAQPPDSGNISIDSADDGGAFPCERIRGAPIPDFLEGRNLPTFWGCSTRATEGMNIGTRDVGIQCDEPQMERRYAAGHIFSGLLRAVAQVARRSNTQTTASESTPEPVSHVTVAELTQLPQWQWPKFQDQVLTTLLPGETELPRQCVLVASAAPQTDVATNETPVGVTDPSQHLSSTCGRAVLVPEALTNVTQSGSKFSEGVCRPQGVRIELPLGLERQQTSEKLTVTATPALQERAEELHHRGGLAPAAEEELALTTRTALEDTSGDVKLTSQERHAGSSASATTSTSSSSSASEASASSRASRRRFRRARTLMRKWGTPKERTPGKGTPEKPKSNTNSPKPK